METEGDDGEPEQLAQVKAGGVSVVCGNCGKRVKVEQTTYSRFTRKHYCQKHLNEKPKRKNGTTLRVVVSGGGTACL